MPPVPEAHLTAEVVTNHAGQWWSVSLLLVDGNVAAVEGQQPVMWFRTQAAGRKGYRERLKALRDAAWRRVE